jgi:pyruvate formate lyase activating enzyme
MTVQCELCPKQCLIEPGQSGECRVRINIDGVLRTVVYGYPCSIHIDPIEKKPLFHFLPGTKILSLATVGCNLHCRNCQNWEISQANPQDSRARLPKGSSVGQAMNYPPEKLVGLTRHYRCLSLAYTYTDPIIFYEYTYDTAKLAKSANIHNVLVTAGYINEEPWKQLLEYVGAANIATLLISKD